MHQVEQPNSIEQSATLTPERRLLAEQHLPVARQLAGRFSRHYGWSISYEDFYSAALEGVVEAAGLFEESRGVPFQAYVRSMIRYRLRDVVRDWRERRRFKCVPEIEESAQPAALESDGTPACEDLFERVREALPERWFDLLYRIHVQGERQASLARSLGMTPQRVNHLTRKALALLRDAMSGKSDRLPRGRGRKRIRIAEVRSLMGNWSRA